MGLLIDNIAFVWITIAIIFLFLEASAIPGVGFLFAGLSALSVGGLISFSIIDNYDYTAQFIFCSLFAIIWFCVLWYPLKKYRSLNNSETPYQNINGSEAILVSETLKNNENGKIKWSGTIMNAKAIINQENVVLTKGERVIIKSITGNTAIIIPENEL